MSAMRSGSTSSRATADVADDRLPVGTSVLDGAGRLARAVEREL